MKLDIKISFKYLLALFLMAAGVFHFLDTDFYARMIEAFLPFARPIVYLSGLIEILLGVMLLIPKTSQQAAFGIIILFILIYPANIYMYLHAEFFPEINEMTLLVRLPVQLLLVWWAYVYTKSTHNSKKES